METKFNFNSQICTSREQSERLLALGLKKETADMIHSFKQTAHIGDWFILPIYHGDNRYCKEFIPAWSLGRLIKDLMPQSIGHLELAVGSDYAGYYEDRYNSENGMYWEYSSETTDMFDNIIATIEWLIKEGYCPKEYLI